MSGVLRDWIALAVEKSLPAVLQWKSGNHQPTYENLSYNDGSLVVHFNESKSVQLIKFDNKRPPYQVLLSDSHTQIRADIKVDATVSFQQKHGRTFLKRTLGGVLLISDFDLIFHPNANSCSRVTLMVNSFELQGSEGSPKFGQPVFVEDSELAHKSLYRMAMASPGPTSTADRVSVSPVLSQAGSINNDMLSLDNPATGGTFCTQVPQSWRESPSVNLAERAVTQSTDTVPKHKSVAAPKPDLNSSLLALLVTTNRKPHEPSPPSSGSVIPASRQQSEPININGEPKGYNPSHCGPSPVSDGAKQRKSNTPSNPIVENRLTDTRCTTQPLQNSLAQQSDDGKIISLQEPSDKNTSSITKSDRQNYKGSQVSLVAKIPSPRLAGESPRNTQEPENGRTPWGKLNRIPRSFLQISKDQQDLLALDDSWLHPISGERKDCVPPKIIQHLDTFHEHKNSSKLDLEQEETASEDSVKDTNEEAETSSETWSEGGTPNIAEEISNSTSVVLPRRSQSLPRQSESDGSGDESISWSSSPDRGACPLETLPDNSTTIYSEELRPKTPRSPSELLPRQSPQTGASTSDPFLYGTLEKSSLSPSSSQVEMELVVPGALDDQVNTLEDYIITSSANQRIPSMTHQSQRPIQVERTPDTTSKHVNSPLPTNWIQLENRLSSDPIIPGTFGNNAFDGSNPVANSMTAKTQPSPSAGEVGPSIHMTRPSISEEEVHTAGQLHRKPEFYSQEPSSIESVSSSPSLRRRSKQAGEILCEYEEFHEIYNPTEAATTSPFTFSKVPPVKDNSLEKSPTSSTARRPQDQESVIIAQVPSTSITPPTQQLKRIVTTNVFDPASKRRQPNTFILSQEQDVLTDPKEIATANRKNFLRNLPPNDDNAIAEQGSYPPPTQGLTKSDIVHQPNSKSSVASPYRSPFNEVSRSQTESPKQISSPLLQNHSSTKRKLSSALDNPNTNTEANTRQINGIQERTSVGKNPSEVKAEAQMFSTAEPDHMRQSPASALETLNLFERFKTTYPSYRANQKNFIRVCVYIEWLRASQKLHPTLWDDFIRAFSEDYSGYVKQCMHTRQIPISGLQFYNEYVPEPRFTNRLITTTTLPEALYLDPKLTAKYREAFEKKVHSQNDSFSIASTPLTSVDETLVGSHSATQVSAGSPQRPEQVSTTMENNNNSKTIGAAGGDSERAHRQVSISNCQATNGRPLFETPSQNIPIGDIRRNLAEPEQGAKALCPEIHKPQDMRIPNVSAPSPTRSRLPWPSHPHRASTPTIVSETCSERDLPKVIKSANSRSNAVIQQKSEQKLAFYEGSPILGRQTPECTVIVSPTSITIPSPTPNRANQREHSLKTSPYSNTFKRKIESMSSPGSESWRDNQGGVSPPAKKFRRPLSSVPRLSFDELVKAYVTRRKRMSGASPIQSTLTTISPSAVSKTSAKNDF